MRLEDVFDTHITYDEAKKEHKKRQWADYSFDEGNILPLEVKHDLAIELLNAVGARNVSHDANRHELIHSCLLPNGMHRNGDANPSSSLNYEKLSVNCLGCGSGGSILWWLASVRGEEVEQARDWLRDRTGTSGSGMTTQTFELLMHSLFDAETTRRTPLPKYSDALLRQWQQAEHHPYLTSGVPEEGLKGRGIPEATLERFGVCYNAEDHRIVLPVWWDGKLRGWQGRKVESHSLRQKYKNTPDFPKDRVLYNQSDHDEIVVVEAPMSVLRHYHHVPNMVATFSAYVTTEQCSRMHDYERVTLWMDNDAAGWKATHRLAEALRPYTDVWVVDSPYREDPADLQDSLVESLIDGAIPYALWSVPSALKDAEMT